MRLRRRLALSGDRESPSRRFDRAGQISIPSRKEHLFPAAVFFAQPAVASRLRSLSLQRAALLFDFEHDVVDARQVLLGGFELQFCRPSARAVLRDPGGFFDQLAPVCRTRAEDHADLALLDDRVGLGAEPGVHQELVNVAEAAHGAVDQVLALPRTVQAPRDFDVASEGVGHLRNHGVPISIGGVVTVAVLVRWMELLERGHLGDRCRCRRNWRRESRWRGKAAKTQANFSGRARLPGIAAVEDHVFHLVAAQALGALLAEDPRNGIGNVALAAPVGPDDGGDALIEGELRPIGEGLETRDFETLETHYCPLLTCQTEPGRRAGKQARRAVGRVASRTGGSLAGPSYCGKTQVLPQHFGLGDQSEGQRAARRPLLLCRLMLSNCCASGNSVRANCICGSWRARFL